MTARRKEEEEAARLRQEERDKQTQEKIFTIKG